MNVIWHKKQGFRQEMKTQDTQIAYNTVACFILCKDYVAYMSYIVEDEK